MALIKPKLRKYRPKKMTKKQHELLRQHNQSLVESGHSPIRTLKAKTLDLSQVPLDAKLQRPSLSVPSWRQDPSRDVPSYHGDWDSRYTARNSIMDQLEHESPEVREAIILKSKSTAPAYNKGAYQPITSAEQAKMVGRK